MDYGYYVGELNDESVLEVFALMDTAAKERDFNAYKSFFSPEYVAIDSSEGRRIWTYRADYLDMVEKLFDDAKVLELNTVVMDIAYSEYGDKATVKVQEEERCERYGDKWHYTSLLTIELGIEDGWIYIDRTDRTTKQVIEDTRR